MEELMKIELLIKLNNSLNYDQLKKLVDLVFPEVLKEKPKSDGQTK